MILILYTRTELLVWYLENIKLIPQKQKSNNTNFDILLNFEWIFKFLWKESFIILSLNIALFSVMHSNVQ